MNEFLSELRDLLIKHEMKIDYDSRQESIIVVSAKGETYYYDEITPDVLSASLEYKKEAQNG